MRTVLLVIFLAACGRARVERCPGADGPALDVLSYTLEGRFDWPSRALAATVHVEAMVRETALRLDSDVEVSAVRGHGKALSFEQREHALVIDLGETSCSPEPLTVSIDYTTTPGKALRVVPARRGDLPVPVFYTLSEPEDTRTWMPSHDTPEDRALFRVEWQDGAVLWNETAMPLPTYLMGIAGGDLVHTDGPRNVEIWHRRGLVVDAGALAARVAELIGLFEERLGAFPFERYRLVLLPDFPGGMEHAAMTFQSEIATADLDVDLPLTAHELAHQWFGDLVTVATWDDLWIKEGMASFFEREAVRAFDEHVTLGPAGASMPREGDAARDVSLRPDKKYTSGPYQRAAWIFTQVRALVGDEAFFSTWRQLLGTHAIGTLSTAEVVDAFGVDPVAFLRAIDAHTVPTIDVADNLATLRDPDLALLAPVHAEWIQSDGAATHFTFQTDTPIMLAPPPGAYLRFDPDDAHPLLLMGGRSLLAPPREAFATWKHGSAGLTRDALISGAFSLQPEDVAELAGAMSPIERRLLAKEACALADGTDWDAPLAELLAGLTPAPGVVDLGKCPSMVEGSVELSALAATPSERVVTEGQLELLAERGLPAPLAVPVWGALAQDGWSTRARWVAAWELERHLEGGDRAALSSPQRAALRDLLIQAIPQTEVPSVLFGLLAAAAGVSAGNAGGNTELIAAIKTVLVSEAAARAHDSAACAAYTLCEDDSEAWRRFQEDVTSAVFGDPEAACRR